MPKVTVLMAVHNGECFLQETIDSILAQTFQDFEFLIINDGSRDRTKEIIQSYDDSRIRLVDNEHNLGLTRSLNKGLELAKGEFIARQDADDISEPERLAKQVAFLETHSKVALVGTWYKEIDAEGKPITNGNLPCDYTQIRWHLLFYCPFVHSAVMLRKSKVLEKIGFYNEALCYSMDYEFWLRIARHLPVANLDEYLIKLRVNPHSMTATYGEKTLEGYRMRVANLADLLKWNKTNIKLNEQRFNKIITLLFGFGSNVDFHLQEINGITEEILRLNTAFIQCHNIRKKDYKSHKMELYTQISDRLIELAHYYFHEQKYQRWQLVLQAYFLHLPIFLSKKNVKRIIKLLT
ncbi:glycosyltransferase [Nostoc sphaeroides CHAB 2801]|uniref:glycosyltransferase family 2 protein n=1 Tax=Nostoc sphaeroides TaxID=446679 RepID=UPI001E2A0CF4|nr:glycosyltransferase [Nostoc sphaeroides]MCC5632355.1 glycosyltransferase [Nostoc sphaeroides CHAB 2801]